MKNALKRKLKKQKAFSIYLYLITRNYANKTYRELANKILEYTKK